MNNKEMFDALRAFETEKGISMEYMLQQIQTSIAIACRNYYDDNDNVQFTIDPDRNQFDVRLVKTVVDEVLDPSYEVSLEEAQQIYKRKRIELGDEVGVPLDPKKLGRIAVSSAKNTIRQGIRDGEKGQTLLEFQSKLGEIVSALVERIDQKTGAATIKIGKCEAMLPKNEQLGYENLKEGDYIKIYVADVKSGNKGPHAIISRTHPEFVKRLFEQQVPEIYDGIVEIKSVSREAGSRTKMAVVSKNADIDAIGACIGAKGARVNKIVEELGGEKIDIIEYNEDPVKYISAALSPATVCGVVVTDAATKSCKVTVPDGQLSLAIGNKGQNARLAARLTGWRIDIRPESGFYGEEDESEELVERIEDESEELVERIEDEFVNEVALEMVEESNENSAKSKLENVDLDDLAAQDCI